MSDLISSDNILFIITVGSVIFGVFSYFRNPQIKSDKNEALLHQDFLNLSKEFTNLRDNHIHTLDVKIDQTNQAVTNLALTVTKLNTIIEERLPKKVQ